MRYLKKIINFVTKLFGYKCIFVEIRGVNLGHIIIESAYAKFFKPIYIIFQKPEANRWLTKKISDNFEKNKFLKNIKQDLFKNKDQLSFKDFQGIYNLLNLGFNVFPKSVPQITFFEQELNECKAFFNKHNLKKRKYVLFCLRDETYYKNFKLDLAPGKNFAFRNSDLENYVGAAQICADQGLTPIRFGFSKNVKTPSVFFDINQCNDYRPWIEAYLAKNALFCVGNFTGSTLYCKIFKVPTLWIDIFWRGCVVGNPGDFLAPKNILLREQKLTLLSQKELGAPKDNLFENYGIPELLIKNLNSNNITKYVEEMILRSLGKIKGTRFRKENSIFAKIHYQKMLQNGIAPTPLLDSWISDFPDVLCDKPDQLEFNLYRKYWLGKSEKWNPDRNHSKFLENFYRFLQK